ncbi:response regulator transcription factor [Streptomyces sp. SID1034]|uniref:response regulator transcription factor n=1 Tax=Streptomyces sp. SID1034 TaxID=2690248 RepID=UPI00192531A2|nr:response regulator transcription factor [Streptomyces sp. SID1034]
MSLPTSESARGLTVALAVRKDIHRYGLEGMLHSLESIASIFSYPTIADATRAAPELSPDLLLTSTAELAEATDPALARQLREHDVRLLVLIGPDERMTPAWASHVHGFVDRSALHLSLLRDAVGDVSAGRFHVSASLARRLMVPADPAPARYGIGHLGPDQRLGTARLRNRDRIHAADATPADSPPPYRRLVRS